MTNKKGPTWCSKMGNYCRAAVKQPCTSSYCKLFTGARKQPVFRILEDIVKKHEHVVQEHGLASGVGYNHYMGLPDILDMRYRARRILEGAERLCDQVFGTEVCLRGPENAPMNNEYIVTINFSDDDLDVDESWGLRDNFDWTDSGWERAAVAYQHEAGWDLAPDEDGVWMAMIVPSTCVHDLYTCSLVGFLILQDRNEDGCYESLAHQWTAQNARRKGVAARLLAAARSAFPLTTAEMPFTDGGLELIKAHWPEIVKTNAST
jgi:hypothetical protein